MRWCVAPVARRSCARCGRRIRRGRDHRLSEGRGHRYDDYRATGVRRRSASTGRCRLTQARRLQRIGAVQGNLDPLKMISGGENLDASVDRILDALGNGPLIFNLGHGITPETPIAHVERMLVESGSAAMSGLTARAARSRRDARAAVAWWSPSALLALAALFWLDPVELYLWIKALHVVAVIAWMAGMLYLPRLFVYHCEAEIGSKQSETFKVMERRLLRAIINPGDDRDLGVRPVARLEPVRLHGRLAARQARAGAPAVGRARLSVGAVRLFAEDRNTQPASGTGGSSTRCRRC